MPGVMRGAVMERREILNRATAAQHQAANPNQSIWVSANAGTGKTHVLTLRVLRLLVDGAEPSAILAITYTRTAAAEMRNRIYNSITTWPYVEKLELISALKDIGIASPSEAQIRNARNLFARLLDASAFLRIETIHAFCQSVLRRFPREAGINPYFRVMEEDQALPLKDEALIATFRQQDAHIAAALKGLAAVRDIDEVKNLMRQMARYPHVLEAVARDPVAVKRALFTHFACADLADDAQGVFRLINALSSPDEAMLAHIIAMLRKYGTKKEQEKAEKCAAWCAQDLRVRHDRMADYLGLFLTQKGALPKNIVSKAVQDADGAITAVMEKMGADIIRQLKKIHAIDTAQNSFHLMQLAASERVHYQSIKRQRGFMDYDDLIAITNRLFSSVSAAWVRYKLDHGIRYIMVDEAQDTSPGQWGIFDQLFEDQLNDQNESGESPPRSVFSVGDFKQSIYSFQGARPDLFHSKAAAVEAASAEHRRNFARVELDTSFRTALPILDIVDYTTGAKGGLDGLAGVAVEAAGAMQHQTSRVGAAGWVQLDAPTIADADDEAGEDVFTLHARRVAGQIKSIIGNTAIASESGGTRLAEAADILVLLRKRDGFYDALHRALQQAGVAISGAGRLVLMEDITCLDLLALGEVMLLPEDDLTLAAVLKSPLFGLDETQLYHLARGRDKGVRLLTRLKDNPAQDEAVGQCYERLLDMMGIAAISAPHEFYSKILDIPTRQAFLRRQGSGVLEILGAFLERARLYEQDNTPALAGFLGAMKASEAEIKREDSEGVRGVRIMTMHGAKGLEAPLVMLPDTMRQKTPRAELLAVQESETIQGYPIFPASTRFFNVQAEAVVAAKKAREDAEDEESNRLLYVAMTRARDGLYVGSFDKKQSRFLDKSWYARIKSVMEEAKAEVIDAEAGGDGLFYGNLAAPPTTSPAPPKKSVDAVKDDAAPPSWLTAPPPPEPTPSRPLSPSRLGGEDDASIAIAGSDRQQALKRGAVIHRLFEILPRLDASQRPAAARRIFAAHSVEGDTETWLDQVQKVMAEPELAPLFAEDALAEVPIGGQVGAQVVSGIIDRLTIRPDAVFFADFKTGQVPESTDAIPKHYLAQMGLYHRLLAEIYPERAMRACLIYTESAKIFWLNAEKMDDALT